MGYYLNSVVFYGAEIERPVTADMDALYATVDEHFVLMLGPWSSVNTRYFICREPTLKRLATADVIENAAVHVTDAEEKLTVETEQTHDFDLYNYALMHELKVIGHPGWIAGAYGS